MNDDHRIALRAQGVLADFNRAGVLGPADVHVAHRLVTIRRAEVDPDVVLAVALTVRAVRAGSVCIDLARLRDIPPDSDTGTDPAELPWPDPLTLPGKVRASALATTSPDSPLQPLRVVTTDDGASLLYLDRYFLEEQRVRAILAERAAGEPAVDVARVAAELGALFPPDPDAPGPDRQRMAAAVAATRWTTVLAGGPGTGKTHTAARIIALLHALHGSGLRVGLCAPTGRAAASLQDAVAAQSAQIALPDAEAVTIHRLLGPRPGGGNRFRHHATNRLPHDVIIVDEASMVSLTLMYHLLEALRPTTRLVMIGDPDQLASVDAGAVLADLVHRSHTGELAGPLAELVGTDTGPADTAAAPTDIDATVAAPERSEMADGVVRLRRRRRFGARIGRLADAVRAGDADEALSILDAGMPDLTLEPAEEAHIARGEVAAWVQAMAAAADRGDAEAALAALGGHRVLCAHREGPAGVRQWAQRVTAWGSGGGAPFADAERPWYPGRPLLLTETDHRARLFNGDTGIVVADDDRLMAAFGRGSDLRLVHPGRLRGVASAYAMTIHRSQGSQYRAVAVVIPPADSALLSRELLYTAITRATDSVRLIGTAEGLRAGVERKVLRASGLRSSIIDV
ncbi:exodeoxyribonuclease V subunit alpha [Williamsia phyllosphaerae]|uniref:RecBCD enzyme subunit RecD n=1 Tax=Williamsia phyllosphaerae TaxID=885042 RepID=A0ABQ1V895_9NOCA|nr:exodeoxyribonuclease V subunit alpha [Williamsia phyllosphaerae]GGF43652.1 RecBCD enzyme subunit RecD [Williamsia phyllosphaerae]